MKKKSKKNQVQLFALKIDAYSFKAGEIFELIEEKINIPGINKEWVVVSNEDYHPVDFSIFQFRQTYYMRNWLLEPIGYL